MTYPLTRFLRSRNIGIRMAEQMNEQEMTRKLVELILREEKEEKESARNEKVRRVLLLLAGGAALATALAVPQSVVLFKSFFNREKSDWDEWKMFNSSYLNRTIRRLERSKLVQVEDRGDFGVVVLTDGGRKKVLKMGLESLKITKPDKWDHRWRMVFYDVFDKRKKVREKFRNYLKLAGFFPLQKSVYLHAYPCEREIEFLKYFLGMQGEVRIVVAEKIENDEEFRKYFAV